MKRSLGIAAALMFVSSTALAAHCPSDVKAIDDALAKKPKLSDAQMKEVKKLRDDGDAAHKAGKHPEAITSLHKAMDILQVKHAEAKK